MNNNSIDISKLKKSADYVRYLALESIERAASGHPGLPLGCAELGVLLYRYVLRFNPGDPGWINRDRFILSAGHGSMLLYSLLYLAGHAVTLEDIGNFRQLGSKTPGHPEYEIAAGIETTTGPLGQGFANAVGCAVEGKMLAERFNKKTVDLFDYTVYTLMGDGCNMEGVGYEAGSLAGHLGLDNLIAIYDSNHITIDGRTDLTFTEDVGKRYEAMNWHVDKADINDIGEVFKKLEKLKGLKGKPKLLVLTTVIGEGLDKKRDTPSIHGAPAGIEEIVYFIQHSKIREIFEKKYGKDVVDDNEQLAEALRKRLDEKAPLLEAPDCLEFVREGLDKHKSDYHRWIKALDQYKTNHPEDYKIFSGYFDFHIPGSLKKALLNYKEEKNDSTRNISGRVLNFCAAEIPQILGGSADLAGSTKASVKSSSHIQREDFSGRNIVFGVREHAMGAVGNGLALNKAMIPFTSTFFTFFDYMKPAVRLAALMNLNHLFIFSHDSIYVGEDGPTHQPIEHLNALRLIPGIYAFRPANDMETAFSYLYFLEKMKGPAAIVTSRQKIPGNMFDALGDEKREDLYKQFEKGGYIFYETDETETPDIVLAGSGSEVSLAVETAKLIEGKDKKRVRVVSIPCMELLMESGISYREELFRPGTPVVLIEAASHRGVNLFYDRKLTLIDIEAFGLSAPGGTVGKHFGLTADAIYKRILENQLY